MPDINSLIAILIDDWGNVLDSQSDGVDDGRVIITNDPDIYDSGFNYYRRYDDDNDYDDDDI